MTATCVCGTSFKTEPNILKRGSGKFCSRFCARQAQIIQPKPRLAPTASPTMLDIAWAAGIYEGEGCCNKDGALHVAQKDPWLLLRLQAFFGGSVTETKGKRCGVWLVSGARARGFAMTIYSLLSPRRQAQIRRSTIGKLYRT